MEDNVSARMLLLELVFVIQGLHDLVRIVIEIQMRVLLHIVEHPQVEREDVSLEH